MSGVSARDSRLPDRVTGEFRWLNGARGGTVRGKRTRGGDGVIHTIEAREPALVPESDLAREIRMRLDDAGTVALTLLSAPDAGKTTLLERTLDDLGQEMSIAVVAADGDPRFDARRLSWHGAEIVHAVMTGAWRRPTVRQLVDVLDDLPLRDVQLLLIEGGSDLDAATDWDLGEQSRIAVLAADGPEDEPLRHRAAFRRLRHAIINKVDLLPNARYDLMRAIGFARDVSPDLEVFCTSGVTGEGMDEWYDFIRRRVRRYALPGRVRYS